MANELAAEWIKIPDGNGGLKKVWIRDSQARRDIATLNTAVSGKQAALSTAQMNAVNSGITAAKVATYDAITVPTKTSDLTNDSGFMTSGKFAIVSGIFAGSTGYTATVSYPTGFTKDNTVILSFNVTFNGTWRTGYGAYADTAGRYFWNLNNDGIQGYNSASAGYNQSWKLVLMRSDI